jgi:hypothetical protein
MDRAGRRPILLSGAIAMAIALTATGWWIYIDQAITPKAGMYRCCSFWLIASGCLRCHLQRSIRHELGSGSLALSA